VAGQWFSPLSHIYILYSRVSCKVSIRGSKQLANDISKQHFTEENTLLGSDCLSRLFPPPGPAEGIIHIVIRHPDCEFPPVLIAHSANPWSSRDPTSPVTATTATRLDLCISCSFWLISTLETIVRRHATVEALYQRLQTYAFIQVLLRHSKFLIYIQRSVGPRNSR